MRLADWLQFLARMWLGAHELAQDDTSTAETDNREEQPKMPGKGRPFPKGVNGNPGGRPKVLGTMEADKERRPNPNKRVPHTSGVKKERTTKSIEAYRKAKLDLVRDIIQTDHIVTRLQNNALADREFMSPGQIRCAEVLLAKTMPNLQSQELKVEGAQSNVLRAPEPLANDQWEAKYGAKKVN